MVDGLQKSHLEAPEDTCLGKVGILACGEAVYTHQVPIAVQVAIVGGLEVAPRQQQGYTYYKI
jgi:intracellular sulfur oxidation DsrE/DsrF family protein